MEHTFVVIKPDAMRRALMGEIISRFENKGFVIEEAKLIWMTKDEAKELYSVHKNKGFFDNLIQFMVTGPSMVMIVGRRNGVMEARKLTGAVGPDGTANVPGTIRGDFATGVTENVVHSSDCPEQALWEANVFFEKTLIREYWP